MKKIVVAGLLALIALHGAAALDFAFKDGCLIAGELQGMVRFQAAFGAVNLDCKLIKGLALGPPAWIELTDGSVLIGAIISGSFAVKWKYGVATLELANIASIGSAVAAAGVGTGSASPAAGASAAGAIGGIDFMSIPGGGFYMGDIAGRGKSDERPSHQVTVDGFKLSKYEITLKQFKAFIVDTAYKAQGKWRGGGDEYPVTDVSWEDANAFCVWFGRKYGVAARLPTEAEWEYAARGGLVGKIYPNGDDFSSEDANCYNDGTRKVGSYPPNGYGLYDMAGNVSEWCNDWYSDSYYASSPAKNPKGPLTGSSRVNRGGSWLSDFTNLRVARRIHVSPDDANVLVGFRLALPPAP